MRFGLTFNALSITVTINMVQLQQLRFIKRPIIAAFLCVFVACTYYFVESHSVSNFFVKTQDSDLVQQVCSNLFDIDKPEDACLFKQPTEIFTLICTPQPAEVLKVADSIPRKSPRQRGPPASVG